MSKKPIFRPISGRVLRLAASLVFCLALFISCTGDTGALDYQESTIKAELTARMEELEFTATLNIDRVSDGGQRRFSLELHSPRGLSGMFIEGELSADPDAPVSIRLGELELGEKKLGSLSGASTVLRAFSISEPPRSVRTITGAEAGISGYERLRRIDFDSFSVWLDPEHLIPVKIEARTDGSDTGLCDMIILIDKIELSD